VHGPLGNALAVEMNVIFKRLPVLHQEQPARAGGHAVLIVADRDPGGGRLGGSL
jgi:hypothetical protein